MGDDWHFVDRKGAPASVRVSGNLVTNSGETVRTALAAGFLVAEDLEQGRLARLLPQYRPVEFSMNAVSPHRHHLSAKVGSFIDLLVQHSVEHQRPIDPFS
jgi:DNA-binding transcriptional LysR family regulator